MTFNNTKVGWILMHGYDDITFFILHIDTCIITVLYKYDMLSVSGSRIRSDDMTWILPSSQPIWKETFYFSIGINNF